MVGEIVANALKLLRDQTNRGDIKLINVSLKELRYALKIFAPYRDVRKVSTVLEERDFRTVDSGEILMLVEKFEGLSQTRLLAEEYARKAKALLEDFPRSTYRDAIVSIPEFILNRKA